MTDRTIENVWWDDVCEAPSDKGGIAFSATTVSNCGGRYASDKALETFELEATAEPTPATRGFATLQLPSRYSPIVAAMPPTSNLCERLLLQCKLALTPQRSSLHPVNFEMIAFLRANRKFWDANTLMSVDAAVADEN
ncbi:hypothetical protein PF010_g6001 [Phytophthora fragariae]|uniref:Pectate lyase n=1 Tax=Phytophthora fragariae TaxID=53985 RepID=A0A6A3LSL8_9STRA|nr:hypothetical protein PF003_g120 [Phytophthora fragariae]KAE9022611.1 hypothetical protein PF011_g4374 [Phytophthora fragariae]KAE9124456.1 hypothetical protein PF010_g6001 [Phytophthora fragariae]KAE9247152.1 hypothetical protein PF004_g4454 [Phytophthora fragariae]KAE9360421.1 hypothetical protein PF008_g1824 [Phytophthora fragariae]